MILNKSGLPDNFLSLLNVPENSILHRIGMMSMSKLERNFKRISKCPINELWKVLVNCCLYYDQRNIGPKNMSKSLLSCIINYIVVLNSFRTSCLFTCLSKCLQMKSRSEYYRLLPCPVGLGNYSLFFFPDYFSGR